MKKIFVLISLLVLLLVGCQERKNDFLFEGSSKNWSADLKVSEVNGSEEKKLRIKYLGKDLSSIQSFSYFVGNDKNEAIFGAKNIKLNQEKSYNNKDLSSDSPLTITDDILSIKISWNDQSESFMLKEK